MTIAEFLEARIAEDEAVARNATKGPWEVKPSGDQPWITEVGSDYWLARASSDPGYPKDGNAQHIARWDPARVLAECAAKRAIIAQWGPHETLDGPNLLTVLATVYKDHPDYLEEWA